MHTRSISRFLSSTALFAMLAATSACETWNEWTGEEAAPAPAPSASVRTPAAAPVQNVNAQELGSIRDNSLDNTTPGGTPKIIPLPPGGQQQAAPAPEQVPQPPVQADGPVLVEQGAAAAVAAAPVLTQTPDTAPAPTPAPANSVALLTVRFNQPHVYYDDALASAVKQAETVKPGVLYDVLSTVPDLSSLTAEQQQKLSSRAKDNLRNVAVKLQQLGVQAERIRIAEQTLKTRSQEIQIYVR